jgi:hypothetical protein
MSALIDLNTLLEQFGVITVMNICVSQIDTQASSNEIKSFLTDVFTEENFKHLTHNGEVLYLDTLKISNLKEEGPKKTFKAGARNVPVVRHGKTIKMNITDALGRIATIKHFFGLEVDNKYNIICGTDHYAQPLALSGEIEVIQRNGSVQKLFLFIPYFLPQSNFALTQEAAGDFAVFDLGGELFPVKLKVKDPNRSDAEKIFSGYYILSDKPFVSGNNSELTTNDLQEMLVYDYN